MNITLLGHDDIASRFAMSRLMALRPAHHYTVFDSGPLAGAAPPAGLAELAAADRALCARWQELGAMPEALREAEALPAPNAPAGLAMLRATAPDVLVSIRYRRILRDDAIAVAGHGVLNLHSGVLPDYQGVMATFWAMLDGAAEVGSTLHRIVDAGIDTGPVIATSRLAVDRSASYLQNLLALYLPGVENIVTALDGLAAGRPLPASPQLPGAGRYFTMPDADALARFAAAGLRLYDGSERAWIEKQSVALSNI